MAGVREIKEDRVSKRRIVGDDAWTDQKVGSSEAMPGPTEMIGSSESKLPLFDLGGDTVLTALP